MVLGVPTLAQSVPVRGDRWLEVRQVLGIVNFLRRGVSQPARVNLRLDAVGDALITGARSSAVLAADTGVGFVNVSENTTIRVQRLQISADGGRITELAVTGGQVRLRVRPFTHPSSRLEIQTPAGVSGVRGTTWGIAVQPSGQTGIATLEGEVTAEAQGETVLVDGGFQSLIVPGEPPTPPEPLRDDPRLIPVRITLADAQTVRFEGRTDPVNFLMINGEPQLISESGSIDLRLPIPPDRRIQATVITPLGTRQTYELAIPS